MAETSVEMVSLAGNSEASKQDAETGVLIDEDKSVEATDGQRRMRGVISQGNTETSQNDPERGEGVPLDEANSVVEAPNTCRRRSRRVASYLWRLCKLGTAVWMYGDISSDALQTRNYYKKSSAWSTDHNAQWKNGTLQTVGCIVSENFLIKLIFISLSILR